jgi:hypothetical protein
LRLADEEHNAENDGEDGWECVMVPPTQNCDNEGQGCEHGQRKMQQHAGQWQRLYNIVNQAQYCRERHEAESQGGARAFAINYVRAAE